MESIFNVKFFVTKWSKSFLFRVDAAVSKYKKL